MGNNKYEYIPCLRGISAVFKDDDNDQWSEPVVCFRISGDYLEPMSLGADGELVSIWEYREQFVSMEFGGKNVPLF